MESQLDINALLLCATPQAWIDAAVRNQDILLIDHANCEKKAAATALNLMFQYGERHPEMQGVLSRLAREELRHFEQVLRVMKQRGIRYRTLGASRYAEGLRRHARHHEPERMVDILLIGAFIEARSCERFHALQAHLDGALADFYAGLAAAEVRHFEIYLKLARQADSDDLTSRTEVFAEVEAALITGSDRDFRFHSGKPV
ncbi:MAG: tRNA-(ms[2]io[6]A)-hydroxylase [Gammaproteobacteria bacterium]